MAPGCIPGGMPGMPDGPMVDVGDCKGVSCGPGEFMDELGRRHASW